MAHDDDTTGEVGQIFFKDLERGDVKVVGRFVKNEEVGILHQYRAEVELAALTAGEFVDVVVLLLRREEEILQKLAC